MSHFSKLNSQLFKMLPLHKVIRLLFKLGIFVICIINFNFCTKEPSPPQWQNTFTPTLVNNNQRDTVYDDEYITFSTDNKPSDRYIWSWSDGSQNDTTQTIYITHQFKQIGLNIVRLRVERGNTYGENIDSIYVLHHDIPHCGFRIDCDDSLYVQNVSHFVANVSTPDCQSTCNFSYHWDFGDGSIGTGYHTTHSFDNIGTYMIKLRVERCNGPDTVVQKQITVSGSSDVTSYKCHCFYMSNGSSFLDTVHTQNLPHNPIKVDGRVLRRSGNANHYLGEYNCNPNGCEVYIIDAFNNLDSIYYITKIPPFIEFACSGLRL
jgi:hypothetical protein